MAEQGIVDSVRKYMAALEEAGIPVSFAVLFGSQAQNAASQWSDIDLLVVSPHFDGPRCQEDIGTLWYSASRVDSRIEPIPCGLQQWKDDTSSAVVEIARREGEPIQAA